VEFLNYKQKRRTECEALSHRERVAVCLLHCKRLAPFYDCFSKGESWGSPMLLQEARNVAARWLRGEQFNATSLSSQLEKVTPDTEDFGSAAGSYALSAATSHIYLTELIARNDLDLILYVLQNCYDIVDFIVRDILDPEDKLTITEEQIQNHPLMREEIHWQFAAIERAKGNEDLLAFVLRDVPLAAEFGKKA